MADSESGSNVPAVKRPQAIMTAEQMLESFNEKDLILLQRVLQADPTFMSAQKSDMELYFPDDGTRMGLNPTVAVYQRYDWGATEPAEKRHVNHPVTTVRFTHTGEGTPYCKKDEVCKYIVKALQKDHMENKGCSDIKYNFLLGNDGTVYEGRGWYSDAERPADYDHLKGNCVDIAYMGDFTVNGPPPPMVISAYNWIIYGEDRGYVQKRPKIIHIPNMDPDIQSAMNDTYTQFHNTQ